MESYVKHLPTLKPTYPFIGNVHEFIGKNTTEMFNAITEFTRSNETPTKIWIGPCLTITLDKPEDMKAVLTSPHCLDKPYMYRFLPSDMSIATIKGTSQRFTKLCGHKINVFNYHDCYRCFSVETNKKIIKPLI